MIIISEKLNSIYNGKYICKLGINKGLNNAVCIWTVDGGASVSYVIYRASSDSDARNEDVYGKLRDLVVTHGFESSLRVIIHENGFVEVHYR